MYCQAYVNKNCTYFLIYLNQSIFKVTLILKAALMRCQCYRELSIIYFCPSANA